MPSQEKNAAENKRLSTVKKFEAKGENKTKTERKYSLSNFFLLNMMFG